MESCLLFKAGRFNACKTVHRKAFHQRAGKNNGFYRTFRRKGAPNLPRPYADLLEDGIHELRIKLKGTQVRILYFFCYQNIIVLTNVFDKHSDKVPKEQIKLAKENRIDFLNRFSEKDI